MKKTVGILTSLVMVISVLLLLARFLAPALFGLDFHTVLSGSMEPTIKTGAMAVMKKITVEEVQIGDIIGFKMEGVDIPICHRVIEILETEEGFVTKGDANEEPDTWVVKPENLEGRVVFHITGVGYIAKFIKTPYGFGLLIGLPAFLIIVLEIKTLFWSKPARRRRPRQREKPSRFPAYLCLLIGLVLIGGLWGMMAQNTQEKTLESFAQKSEDMEGPLYVSERNIQNKGILPLVICLFSEDKTVSFSESCFRLSTEEQKKVEITGNSGEAIIKTGCFFSLLPREFLHQLFAWNSQLSPLIAAAVWILPLTIIAFLIVKGLISGPKIAEKAKYIRNIKRRRFSYG